MDSEMDSDPWRLHPVRRRSGSAERSRASGVPTAVPNSLQGVLGQEGRAGTLGKTGPKLVRKCTCFSRSCPVMGVNKWTAI